MSRLDRGYANPDLLIDGDELEKELGAEDLRIVDCNVVMTPKPDGGLAIVSGRADWEQSHIPGSCFLDLLTDLAADHPTLRFMMPSPEQFARVVGEAGIGDGHRVVLYARDAGSWATRLFLMFRALGFDNVRVLDGGWDKWAADRRPVTDKAPAWPHAVFTPHPRPGQILGKSDVLDAVDDSAVCLINALAPAQHSGEKISPSFKRAGHIKGSVNVFANSLVDPETKCFLSAADLKAKFDQVGALNKNRIITYCGGGISATTDSFALMLIGYDNVALYDGSLTEWGPDDSLPMETGA